ncbi:MAG: hypothetical protein ACOCW8_02550 [bacterium]
MGKNLGIKDYDAVVKWSYSLAKEWVITNLVPHGVISARKFEAYKSNGNNLPRHFPRKPHEYFKNKGTWLGWRDFLGYPNQSKSYYSYEDAKKIVRVAGIMNSVEYREWKERPDRLPARPERHYEQWTNWKDFLGDNYKVENKGNRRLSAGDVRIIKHQLNMGVSGSILAKNFNVSEMQISRIRNGENWAEID